jgi:hypothetical protein
LNPRIACDKISAQYHNLTCQTEIFANLLVHPVIDLRHKQAKPGIAASVLLFFFSQPDLSLFSATGGHDETHRNNGKKLAGRVSHPVYLDLDRNGSVHDSIAHE